MVLKITGNFTYQNIDQMSIFTGIDQFLFGNTAQQYLNDGFSGVRSPSDNLLALFDLIFMWLLLLKINKYHNILDYMN